MSFLVKPTKTETPRSIQSSQMALLYAGVLALMAVAQLFTFEGFVELLNSYNLPFGVPPLLVASGVVIAEVFALPFLLRMDLSLAFRWLSMGLGWLVAVFWLFMSYWVRFAVISAESAGMLGSLPVTPGPWMTLLAYAFIILAIWASWGLWPNKGKK